MDRWAGTDGEYDRRAGTDGAFDRWAGPDREYDRRAATGDPFDRWTGPDREYDRRAGPDREYAHLAETAGTYDRHDRRPGYARSPKVKWIGLLVAWVIVSGVLLLAVHLTILIWVIMVGLLGYVVYGILRETPRAERPTRRRATATDPVDTTDGGRERFNPPPGWPEPPLGWTPPPGWQPNPAWPPAPPGWQFWLPSARRGAGDRTARIRHHRGGPDEDGFTDRWR